LQAATASGMKSLYVFSCNLRNHMPLESRRILKRLQDDAIQWIVEAALPTAPLYELCIRILYVNFSAIHTTSVSIAQALYDLAVHREFQDPIRDEIKCILKSSGGWTRHALTKMRKLDSSLKESQRLHPVTTGRILPRLYV
jgi:cytochrome P450